VKKSQTKALRNSRANNGINKKAVVAEDIFIKECGNLNGSKNWQSILKLMAEGGGKGRKEELRNIDFNKIKEGAKELAGWFKSIYSRSND
jgi:hypothetical protein